VKNSGSSDRKAEQDLTIEMISGKIVLPGLIRETIRLFGLTLTKSLKQFHALQREAPTGLKTQISLFWIIVSHF